MSYCSTLLVNINNERDFKEFLLERKINQKNAELKNLKNQFNELEKKIKSKEKEIFQLEKLI